MPFLAPLIPFIPEIIQGAGTAIGAVQGIKGAKKAGQSEAASQAQSSLFDLSKQFQTQAGAIQPTAQGYLDQSRSAFDSATNFWAPLLKGGAGATSVLAPDIARTNAQYDQALQTQQQLNPRGGPGSAFLAQQPYAKAAQIGGMYSSLRPQAANAMSQIGGQTGALGVNSLYAMLNALQGATGASGTLLNADVANRYANMSNTGQQLGIGQILGGSIFDLLKQIPGLGGAGGGWKSGGSLGIPSNPNPTVWNPDTSYGGLFGIPKAGSPPNI